jgi:hypothetical protein
MRPVSLSFIVAITLLAVASAAFAFVVPNPAFNLAAILLGFYALHAIALRMVVVKTGKPAPVDLQLRALREDLEHEKAGLEMQRAELARKQEAAEQQWQLLREMVQQRVQGGQVEAVVSEATPTRSAPIKGPLNTENVPANAEASGRVSGRW